MSPSLEDELSRWKPEARDKAVAEIERRLSTERKIWYCKRPRPQLIPKADGKWEIVGGCDGRPHDGAPYPHARADQWPPPGADWLLWLILSGRGAGKTKTATEWVRSITKVVPAIALIGRRGVDVRATMIEGAGSGLIAACERAGVGYTWEPSKREFTFENGCKAFGYSAEEPDSLRGREHGAAWADEFCHMPLLNEVWSNLEFGLRVPGMPGGAKILGTSTPLPLPFLKEQIVKPSTRRVTVSTSANLDNLDPGMRERILAAYAGTRKGRQELEGEILEDVEGALWSDELIRVMQAAPENMDRRITAIDPAGTANRRSDETGIVTAGKLGREGFVLADDSGKYSPTGWADKAIDAYLRWGSDAIVVEKNFGGDMVRTTIEQQAKERGILVRVIVTTATKSKQLRAEPIVALYEQKRVYHTTHHEKLENEMLTWVPGKGDSPNRIDALVWALGELFQRFGQANIASPTNAVNRIAARPRSVTTMSRRSYGRGFGR